MAEYRELASRRAFLSFLASSPALLGARSALGQALTDPYAPEAIAKASDAINVFDFHEAAKRALMPGHYTYRRRRHAAGESSGLRQASAARATARRRQQH